MIKYYLFLSLIIILANLAPQTLAQTALYPASRAQDFVNSEGINTHVEYWNTAYKNEQAVIADLSYLGIHNVRESMPYMYGDPAYDAWTGCEEMLATAGLKLLFTWLETVSTSGVMTTALDTPSLWAHMQGFMAQYPGSTAAIQGLNEPSATFTYAGIMGEAAQVLFQHDMYTALRADTAFNGIPVYNGSFSAFNGAALAGNMTGMLDDTTRSLYPRGGSLQSAEWYQNEYAKLPSSTAPLVITAGGYDTMPGMDSDGSQGVDVTVQAKYTLDLFADTFSWGILHTYIYEFLDELLDPNFKDHEQHFGVFYNDESPKPAAIALHNLNLIGC